MEELIKKLNALPGAYFAFVAGISKYAEKEPERLQRVLSFLNSRNDLTPSEVVKFVSDQPDFFDFENGIGVHPHRKHLSSSDKESYSHGEINTIPGL